ESTAQQHTSADPRQFAWIFVGSEEKCLHHVENHDGDHKVGAPVVDTAQEPSEKLLMVQVLQTGPGLVGGRDVHQCKRHSRDDLNYEAENCPAAEDIEITVRAGGNLVSGRTLHEFLNVQPMLEPECDGFQHGLLTEVRRVSEGVHLAREDSLYRPCMDTR